ncbi:MAG: glycosyltransferase family 4 protein [Methylacidiphilales bacterium]|nr:glycosyltransferase family 4 protein [Candidatus Methylacidiphilales bacterium]
MKILFISSSSGSRGGGEIFLARLGPALAGMGHEVALWASEHPRMDELCSVFSKIGTVFRSPYRNTYDRRFRGLGFPWGRKIPGRITRVWEDWKPDVIHFNKQNLEDGLDLLAAAKTLKTPGVCTIHLTQSPSALGAVCGRLRDWNARRALRRFSGNYITVHESRAVELRRFLGPENTVKVVSNGVEVPAQEEILRLRNLKRVELKLEADDLLVIGVGRFVEQKRPLLFLEQAARLKKSFPRARFLWVGGENEKSFGWVGRGTRFGAGSLMERWRDEVRKLRMEDCVGQEPWQEELRPFLAAADAYFHTAEYEGLPFSLLEAMAAGLPPAVSPEVRRDLDFLDTHNSIELTSDLDWAGADGLFQRIGSKARETIQERYSIRKMAGEYEKLYLEAAAH